MKVARRNNLQSTNNILDSDFLCFWCCDLNYYCYFIIKKMGLCFVPLCDHTNKNNCKMFNFPKDLKLKEKWEKLIGRDDRTSNKFSLICSCHFKDGDKNNLPSIFKWNTNKQFSFSSPERKKRKKLTKLSDLPPSRPCASTVSTYSAQLPSCSKEVPSCSKELHSTSIVEITEKNKIDGSKTEKKPHCSTSASIEAENYFLKKEVEELRKQLHSIKLSFSFEVISNNDKLISLYTGLPDKIIFLSLFKYLDCQKFTYYLGWKVVNMKKIDQLLITLMKLRLNLLHEDLAVRFNCSIATVTNIVMTWIHVIHISCFQKFLEGNIPSRAKNKTCLPSAFSSFTNCRMILDCTEVYTAVPNNLEKQRSTYSNYKRRTTLKGLIGVAPNGTVTFVSDLYVGNTSDKRIVEHCGVLKHFCAGDLILGDKGFLISDILPQGVAFNIPPFLATPQFSPEEIKQTRTIAKARIHIERAIGRIKNYKILTYIPSSMRSYSSTVFKVCAFLTTLNYPLIQEVGELLEQ